MREARPDMPDAIEKRDLLASDTISREEVLALAGAYLQDDALSDACNFFDKIGDVEGLEKVKRRAIETGNAHVLTFDLGRSRHILLSKEEWREAGQHALDQGKFGYAAQAFRKAGDPEREAEARRRIPGASSEDAPPSGAGR